MRQLRMGVIGLGQGAAHALPAIEALPEAALVAGADTNDRMRTGFVERFAGTRAYATVAELCADPEIDAVWVATPNKYHRDHAVAAMRAGKHVLVEKPMAVSVG